MTESIKNIFEQNIRLLGDIDKAIIYFREQQYDLALHLVADSVDRIKIVIEAIIAGKEYFNLVETKSMLEMLTGLLDAKRNKDFILLADLLELQMVNFLIGVQELIMSKDEIEFDEERYKNNVMLLLEYGSGFTEDIMEPINTIKLLEHGYSVEFTSCGLMTLATEYQGQKYYFHTNHRIQTEAFLLAKHWYEKEKDNYIVYGFGLGYHIQELRILNSKATIEIYESDVNVLQLASAFVNLEDTISDKRIRLIYDPELSLLKERIQSISDNEKILIHYPSYRNIKKEENKEMLQLFIPWSKALEEI